MPRVYGVSGRLASLQVAKGCGCTPTATTGGRGGGGVVNVKWR